MKRVLALLILGVLPLCSADRPAPTPMLAGPDGFTGPVAQQTFAEGTYFFLPARTDRNGIPALMRDLVPRLQKTIAPLGLGVAGPMVLVYPAAEADPVKPFDLELGILVPPGTQPSGEGKVRTLPAFRCATTVFTGPFMQVGKAYERLFPTLHASGKLPTREFRQMILFWENEQSPNNMMLIQVGIQ
jgi:effector-binding domain-containing protein